MLKFCNKFRKKNFINNKDIEDLFNTDEFEKIKSLIDLEYSKFKRMV
jgi:hypothetical protein